MRAFVVAGLVIAAGLGAKASLADERTAPPTAPYESPPAATYAPPLPLYAQTAPSRYAPAPGYYYPPPYDPPRPPKGAWYGWQTLSTDGVALGLALAVERSRNRRSTDVSPFAYVVLGTYNLGAPIVHVAHGNAGRALGSLAGRSIPALLFVTKPPDASENGPLLLTVLSIPAMIAIDAAILAREDPEPPPAAHALRIAPTASASPHGGSVGFAGIF